MKYEQPQIIDLSQAVFAIHGGQEKVPSSFMENKSTIDLMTTPAYEADEQSI